MAASPRTTNNGVALLARCTDGGANDGLAVEVTCDSAGNVNFGAGAGATGLATESTLDSLETSVQLFVRQIGTSGPSGAALTLDRQASAVWSDGITVTATATALSTLIGTAGGAAPTSPCLGVWLTVPAGATIYIGGAGVTTSATTGANAGTPITGPAGAATMAALPSWAQDPAAVYLIAGGNVVVKVLRGLQ